MKCFGEEGFSHRCTVSDILDGNYLNVRVTRGRMVFRSAPSNPHIAVLNNHPVPRNYKRGSVECNMLPDGLTLDYTIVDEEQPVTIG